MTNVQKVCANLNIIKQDIKATLRYNSMDDPKNKRLVESIQALERLGRIKDTMSLKEILITIFIMKGHLYRHLKNHDIFTNLVKKLDDYHKQITKKVYDK